MSNLGPDRHDLLVFSDDWGRHPSSCQHLVGRLLDRHRVTWVNTIGMRAPALNAATMWRGMEKVAQWIRPHQTQREDLPANLCVINPRMWPWFRSRWDRRINRRLLLKSLAGAWPSAGGPVTAVTTIPIAADLVGRLPVDRWIYYCVDDFSVWPGLDHAPLRAMEVELLQTVDRVVAVSETLRDKIRAASRREAGLLTHGVDLEFWRPTTAAPSPQLAGFQRPLFLFWGVIDRRMDAGFVRRLAADIQEGSVVLVGPLQGPDAELFSSPRVHHIPALPLAALPGLAIAADVLIMPYRDCDVTRAMQPLKLLEYLAAGRPAVVRDLPSTRPWLDCLDAVETAAEFSRLARLRSAGLPATQAAARARLADESWDSKATAFEEFIFGTGELLQKTA